MSLYMATARKIKIKPELQEDFECLFYEKYELIKNPIIKEFADDYFINPESNGHHPSKLKNWHHYDYVDEWKGKYQTKYEKRIFTFSYYYNLYGFFKDFYQDFEHIILPVITEKIIEQDAWCEPS